MPSYTSLSRLYQLFLQHRTLSTDTRNITPGSLFFALKGDRFDGNTFAASALGAGAAYAIVDDATYQTDERTILVPNVLETLQQLALHHRNQLNIPFLAITGSNGKTTTKELINSVLSQGYKTYATRGNLNNHIGVPLTLLAITDDTEFAVIEMGANHQKEIAFLCTIACPTHGLITNVGKAHLEGFGGFEGVKLGKGELYHYLAETSGTVFINADNTELLGMSGKYDLQNIRYYGAGGGNFISGNLHSASPELVVEWQTGTTASAYSPYLATAHLTGAYNVENVLSAIAVGSFFRLSPEDINRGIESYVPANYRSQIMHTATNTLICDYYNANPSSMAVALDSLKAMPAQRKMAVLGDMFELGTEAAAEHQMILNKALELHEGKLIFIGSEFYKMKNSRAEFFETTAGAAEFLQQTKPENYTILIKGSRGMQLEQLIGLL